MLVNYFVIHLFRGACFSAHHGLHFGFGIKVRPNVAAVAKRMYSEQLTNSYNR